MLNRHKVFAASAALLTAGLVAGCGGGNGDGSYLPFPTTAVPQTPAVPTLNVTAHEVIDPHPGAGNRFADQGIILPNGNFVLGESRDSTNATSNGAVHLFDPEGQTLIASIVGEGNTDFLGAGGLIALPNNNFVIASQFANTNGLSRNGRVMLVNGTTGAVIATLDGDRSNDFFGGDQQGFGTMATFALANGNFVIVSTSDDSGSVVLVDGNTGAVIGNRIGGGQRLGTGGVIGLPNSNFVVVSPMGGNQQAGSIMLFNGTTGAQIGSTVEGSGSFAQLGSNGATRLANGNFVVSTERDNGFNGSVRLFSGQTGLQIGAPLSGAEPGDFDGMGAALALGNNNYVVAAPNASAGGNARAGSVFLMNGETGAQIGSTLSGDAVEDSFGNVVVGLANGNFAIGSISDDSNGLTNNGSVTLVNGTTGLPIGNPIVGDATDDMIGTVLTPLTNNNFTVFSPQADVGGIDGAGSLMLVDGSTGQVIGTPIVGDREDDFLFAHAPNTLSNGNYVFTHFGDEVNGNNNAGSVGLVNGTTGARFGTLLEGDAENDQMGHRGGPGGVASNAGIFELPNGHIVVTSPFDNVGLSAGVGSVITLDGSSGARVGTDINGIASGDIFNARVTSDANFTYYILRMPRFDKDGLGDSGRVEVLVTQ